MKRWVLLAGLGVALGAGWITRTDSRGGHDPARGGVVIVPGRDATPTRVVGLYPVKQPGPTLGGPLAADAEEDFGPGGIWDDRGAPGMWAPPEPPTAAD